MNKIYLALGIHFHQPTGNFEHIFERAYNVCYKPFLELVSHSPSIKMTFHISGCLLDYLHKKHPEMIELIKNMVSRKQIEIMGGGYYEPILTAIPERDVTGQIKMMSEYIKNNFGVTPKGMWIAERVWDPSLAKLIYRAGIRYLILDDEHFLRSGIKKEDMHGYFLTGKGKEKLAVFPSDKNLRYLIPFKLPHETIDYLRGEAEKKQNILFSYGDDGEKFGEWPGTHKWVFEEQWLRKFFDALEANKDWLKLVHFSDYLKKNNPTATLTIEQGSYEEMMEWSGGSWLNFLSKYPETNQLQKKMLYISSKIDRLLAEFTGQKETKEIEKARRELYMGQCNCGYWHGVFGGLYLYHLRQAIYSHLIEAEKIADSVSHKKRWLDIHKLDYDQDGKNEFIMENEDFSIYVDPAEGGTIKELDYRPISLNLTNSISRKKEVYHQKILDSVEDKGGSGVATIHDDFRKVDPSFKNMLFYDRFGRYFLRSYFVKKDLRFEDFVNASYEELGDFSNAAYLAEEKNNRIILQRKSKLLSKTIRLQKEIRVKSKNEIEISCSVEEEGPGGLNALLGMELNLTMPDLNSDRYAYYLGGNNQGNLNTAGSASLISSFGISDSLEKFGIRFNASKKPLSVWHFPVRTVSQSESSYELNYQCSCIFPLWNLDFNKEHAFDFKINLIMGG